MHSFVSILSTPVLTEDTIYSYLDWLDNIVSSEFPDED